MFALETLKDLVLSGAPIAAERLPSPTTVGALVERRLSQLSAPALKLARVAALAGANFSASLAAAVLDLHPLDIAEPWRELEAALVIRDGAFAHDLILKATRASVPEAIARLLHRRIAERLQADEALPARIAPHWGRGREQPQGADAERAGAVGARTPGARLRRPRRAVGERAPGHARCPDRSRARPSRRARAEGRPRTARRVGTTTFACSRCSSRRHGWSMRQRSRASTR
ncbi:MAG TPA: hypothetical protein VNU71_03990 [Burkholderiaceae bacterium]|nr:hypothetical protein [Burkholderiaceae bacterium]